MYQSAGKKFLYAKFARYYLLPLLFAIIFLFANFWIATSILIIFFIILFPIAYLEYKNASFKIDNLTVYFTEGFLATSTTSIPMTKITNTTFNQGLLQKLFGVGNIIINQEDSVFSFKDIDRSLSNQIIEAINSKANIHVLGKNPNVS